MKKYLVFITLLLSNIYTVYCCGFYPYGEELRYSLFLPKYFSHVGFDAFNYHADLLSPELENSIDYSANVYDWFDYTHKKVSLEQIDECLHHLAFTDIHDKSTNQFVQYLYKHKLDAVIRYLIIAKKCEDFNKIDHDDEWERNSPSPLRNSIIMNELNQSITHEKSPYLKRKYAFLILRTAYYTGNLAKTTPIFKEYFEKGKKDYLYYWASFFNCFNKEAPSVDIANIMAYSPEKRYASYYYFHEQFNLKKALATTTAPSDIANLYAYASVQRLDPNLGYLKIIYQNASQSAILDFLLLREINKIEDWVYTPYYTNFSPAVEFDSGSDKSDDILSTAVLRARSEKDRLYAKQVLDFIQTIDYKKIKDPLVWKAAEIQLLFITKNYPTCLNKISDFEERYASEKVMEQIEKIKALCMICNQPTGAAVIKEEAKPIILKYLNDKRFTFSIGRELEYRNNLPDGLALMALNNNPHLYDYFDNAMYWQGNRHVYSENLVFFYEYFDYLDFVYSAKALKVMVDKINPLTKDKFYLTIYAQLLHDKNYLLDLLGTKYIREEQLQEAERTFKQIGQQYWEENYNAWERDKFEDRYTFDQNPFYDLKHTEPFVSRVEKFEVTKLSVTSHLMKYLALANNPNTKDRDYYYFIVANCYFNMTQYGNSWMMRRFYTSSMRDEYINESYIDEMEYRSNCLAQKYYRLAYEHAKTAKFKALCLRMEDYAKEQTSNKYLKLREQYPQYYDELTSSCIFLETYFKARR